jgi:hypothetical protein
MKLQYTLEIPSHRSKDGIETSFYFEETSITTLARQIVKTKLAEEINEFDLDELRAIWVWIDKKIMPSLRYDHARCFILDALSQAALCADEQQD